MSNKVSQKEKLRSGPCAEVYFQLEKCAKDKNIDSRKHKEKLTACPNETDLLIKCMNKNPLHFFK